jgi:hypothetical protein
VRVSDFGLQVAELAGGNASLAGDFQSDLRDFFLQILQTWERRALHVGVVAAAQPAIARQNQQRRTLRLGTLVQQRVADFQPAVGQIADQAGDAAGVGRGGRGPVHRLFEARGGNQLHGPRDLADVAD